MSDNVWNEIRSDYDAYYYSSFTWLPDPKKGNWKRRWERFDSIILRGSWPAVVCYRLKAWAYRRSIPLLPFVCDTLNRLFWGIVIGDRVKIGRGLCIVHGYVVIDGAVVIGKSCYINPHVTIGLRGGDVFTLDGPRLGDDVYIGTGAKVLGAITVGNNVTIGANAVVISDVPDNHTAVGAPARAIPKKAPEEKRQR
ncbi:MAG: serine acetyltransferase [Dehalococcoidia bacterium]|jgi:serine O-acetyltransferase